MFDEHMLFFVPSRIGISYKVKKQPSYDDCTKCDIPEEGVSHPARRGKNAEAFLKIIGHDSVYSP